VTVTYIWHIDICDIYVLPLSVARPRPVSTAAPATPAASTNGEGTAAHRRRVITKPPVPKQTPLEKKPAVPRAPRTPRPINAPTPDLKNVRSKIGSIDNIKYQPGGGKVGQNRWQKRGLWIIQNWFVAVKIPNMKHHDCLVSADELALGGL